MKTVLCVLAAFLFAPFAFGADPYGIDRREIGEPFLGKRFAPNLPDIQKDDGLPKLLSQTGVFEPFKATGELVPTRAMIPYVVNTPLWSDSAKKKRWMYVPKDAKITYSPDGAWTFPAGTVFVKQFDLVVNENTGAKKRLETRFLIVDSTGKDTYAITYKWNDDGLDAKLVGSDGLDGEDGAGKPITITNPDGTSTRDLKWLYPGRGTPGCLSCHIKEIGANATKGVLGVKTAQLNGGLQYLPSGITDNQLRTLNHLLLFNGASASLDTAVDANGTRTIADQPQMAQFGDGVNNTAFTLETRVRSYLDANCSHCHGAKRTDWDGRFISNIQALKDDERLKFYDKAADISTTANTQIYARDNKNMPRLQLRPTPPVKDQGWLNLLSDYLTKSFNPTQVAASALNSITITFDGLPGVSATTPGNYTLALVSDKTQTIALQGNGTISGNSVSFSLAGNMTKSLKYQITVTGDVLDTGGNKAWKGRVVQFSAPNPPSGPPAVDDGSPPGNDNFASAIVLAGADAADTGFNCYASTEAGEPPHADNPGGNSVWWVWTAPANIPVKVDTFGSDFDTLLAVYTGSSVSSLTVVASDDDADDEFLPSGGNPATSFLTFDAVQGQTYYIAVDGQNDGFYGQCGNIQLHLHAAAPPAGPANDAFANAFVLTGASGSVSGANTFATKENGEPEHAGDPGGASVWWTWTAPADGEASFDTHGSSFDTLLAVYLGADVSNLTLVAANDDDSELFTSSLQFTAAAGITYRIVVDGYSLETGNLVLNHAFTPAPAIMTPVVQTVPDFLVLPSADGAFHLQVNGPAGAVMEIQASDDLVNWEPVQTKSMSGKAWIFSEQFATEPNHRFYRVARHLQLHSEP